MMLPKTTGRILDMQPVDGSDFYDLGKALHPLSYIKDDSTVALAWYYSLQAIVPLEDFLSKCGTIYAGSTRLTPEAAHALLEILREFRGAYSGLGLGSQPEDSKKKIPFIQYQKFAAALTNFEAVFKAEFRHGNMFLASPKGAYNLEALILRGETLLPQPDFSKYFPDSVGDVKAGARCLAFELYTASGFHFHRANESVMLKYLSILAPSAPPPDRNMGRYIQAMEAASAPKAITSCLRDLKDMHRNPLMHPDQSIENADDAIALFNAIHGAIVAMMREVKKLAPLP